MYISNVDCCFAVTLPVRSNASTTLNNPAVLQQLRFYGKDKLI